MEWSCLVCICLCLRGIPLVLLDVSIYSIYFIHKFFFFLIVLSRFFGLHYSRGVPLVVDMRPLAHDSDFSLSSRWLALSLAQHTAWCRCLV
ncbi:hypothetical protein L2E82_42255 [Cichorium intybus]|uniref:Uncharacterized protein n=1 Tax=Cichorium intybus TaxID=13427 RepID=A0ACB8ZLA6_CICIN|nr:hypothetical protein L2E82_42255 [Cichorium intybus]